MFFSRAFTFVKKNPSTNVLKLTHKFISSSATQLSGRLANTAFTSNDTGSALINVDKTPTKSAMKLAYRAICSKPKGVATHDVLRIALEYEENNLPTDLPTEVVPGVTYKRQKGVPPPPHPKNSIQSVRHLKKFVLPWLEEMNVIEKFHITIELSEEEIKQRLAIASRKTKKKANYLGKTKVVWLWRVKQGRPRLPQVEVKPLFGTEVGLGRDWSHLNQRRQVARQEKIHVDISWLKELEAIKAETVKADEAESS